jgi:hypothetical protein
LLVLSEHSVRSRWVQDEVEACLERKRRRQRQVLFPILLDEAVTDTIRRGPPLFAAAGISAISRAGATLPPMTKLSSVCPGI